MSVVRTEGLSVGYRGRRAARVVLDGLDLDLTAGQLTCLLGANGSGKSTLLRTLAGMQPALSGRVLLAGDDIGRVDARERARRVAVVLTDRVDAGGLTGADLVALGRHPHTGWSGRLGPADREAVAWALDATRATALARRPLSELSDGERQRLLVARALAQRPAVLALDEPVAFVDVPRRVELLRLLRHLARSWDLAVLLTTHDVDLALRNADVLWLLQPGDPATLAAGGPEDLVLAGALGRAFPADDVAFAPERGTFVSLGPPIATGIVRGSGAAALWAQRALERQGVAVATDATGAELIVDVLAGPRWRLTAAGDSSDHETLAALGRRVRFLAQGTAGPSVVSDGASAEDWNGGRVPPVAGRSAGWE